MPPELNPILLIFLSYTIGVFGTLFVQYFNLFHYFENRNYISDKLTRQLGVLKFGWLVKNSFMGMFNQNLKYRGKAKKATLEELKKQMTYAEVGHLFGFIFLLLATFILVFWKIEWWYFFLLIVLNIIFNLYLVFLQQFNKRRINKILRKS